MWVTGTGCFGHVLSCALHTAQQTLGEELGRKWMDKQLTSGRSLGGNGRAPPTSSPLKFPTSHRVDMANARPRLRKSPTVASSRPHWTSPSGPHRPAPRSAPRARPHCAPCARSGRSSAGEGAMSPARRSPPGTQVSLRRFDFWGEPGSPRLRRGGGWQARAAPRDPRRSGHSHRAGVTPASPSHRAAGACFSVRVARCHRQAVPPGRTVSSLKTRFVTP